MLVICWCNLECNIFLRSIIWIFFSTFCQNRRARPGSSNLTAAPSLIAFQGSHTQRQSVIIGKLSIWCLFTYLADKTIPSIAIWYVHLPHRQNNTVSNPIFIWLNYFNKHTVQAVQCSLSSQCLHKLHFVLFTCTTNICNLCLCKLQKSIT